MVSNFYETDGFSLCIGAADRAHIGTKKPKGVSSSDFINRKGFYSLNILAFPDYKYCFFDVIIKWLVSVHDARIFENSLINRNLKEGIIPSCPKVIVSGEQEVSVCMFGLVYPLMPFLMKEYVNGGQALDEQFYGYCLPSVCMVIENLDT